MFGIFHFFGQSWPVSMVKGRFAGIICLGLCYSICQELTRPTWSSNSYIENFWALHIMNDLVLNCEYEGKYFAKTLQKQFSGVLRHTVTNVISPSCFSSKNVLCAQCFRFAVSDICNPSGTYYIDKLDKPASVETCIRIIQMNKNPP